MGNKSDKPLELDKDLYEFIVGGGSYYELHPSNPFYGMEYFTIVLSENYNVFLDGGSLINHNGQIYKVIFSMGDKNFTKTSYCMVVKNEDSQKLDARWKTSHHIGMVVDGK